MSRLIRTSDVTTRPVVTMDGEDVAQIKDIVYSADGGAVEGFTLAGRGVFSGPLNEALPWSSVMALGPDAVMIHAAEVLTPVAEVLKLPAAAGGSGGNVIGSVVLTDAGTELGTVVDVVLEVSDHDPRTCDVVGYEVETSEALEAQGAKVFVPLPSTLAASGEHLMVSDSAKDFVAHDLAEFGASLEAFRRQLKDSD